MADGDGRALLNLVEQIAGEAAPLDAAALTQRLTRRAALFDKSGDEHYNLISALHKSVRGSDPDAALYWLARMLKGGEDPRFLARRITRMAVEDIGLADPRALTLLPRRLGDLRAARLARGRARAGAGGDLPRARAEVERRLRAPSAAAMHGGRAHRLARRRRSTS